MKICIVGLGAVGGWLAAGLYRLHPGRVALSALARGATLAAVQAQGGLRLWPGAAGAADAGAAPVTVPLLASADPQMLGRQDLVIVAVKATALAAVAPQVRALCGPQTAVLVALNGVPWWFFDGLGGACDGLRLHSTDPDGSLHALLPAAGVLGCVVHAAITVPAPGSVRHVQGRGLIIGRPSGIVDTGVQRVVALLAEAGFAATASDRIQRDVWFKLWGNMTVNPISALTGATTDAVLDDPLVRALCSRVMAEAQAIGQAIGLPIEQGIEDRHAVTRRLGRFKTSMLQDAEAGRPLELQALIGAVHEIGRHLGLATPDTDALYGLTRLMAAQRGLLAPV